MKLKDIKKHYIIELRNGDILERIDDSEDVRNAIFIQKNNIQNDICKICFGRDFNEDLTCNISSQADIVKVIKRGYKEVIKWEEEVKINHKEKVNQKIDFEKLDKFVDVACEMVNDLDLDDEELIKEREKLNELYEKLKEQRKVRNNNINNDEKATINTIKIEGQGKLNKEQLEKIKEIIENLK